MAILTGIDAQASFDDAYDEFVGHGEPVITDLKGRMVTAVSNINSQTYLLAADFTSLEAAMSKPLEVGGVNQLNAKLLSELQSGEYGLGSYLSSQILTAATAHEDRLLLNAIADATRLSTAGGFTAPTGVSTAVTARLQNEQRDKLLSVERDLTIKGIEAAIGGRREVIAAALGVEESNAAAVIADMNRILQSLEVKLEQYKTYVQAQLEIATAAMQALNVNVGLSVSGSATVGGSETISATLDNTATVLRESISTSWDTSHSTRVSTSDDHSESRSSRQSSDVDYSTSERESEAWSTRYFDHDVTTI